MRLCYWLKTGPGAQCNIAKVIVQYSYIPGTPVKKPIRKYARGRIFGKRATKYTQGVFYRSLSRAVTGVNREVIKKSFQVCGILAKGLAVPVAHLNASLRGILGYREGLKVVQQYDNAFEGEEINCTASNSK